MATSTVGGLVFVIVLAVVACVLVRFSEKQWRKKS